MNDRSSEANEQEWAPPVVRDSAPYVALCLTARGPYWKLSGPFKRLRARMGDLGLRPTGPAFGIFYDDPDEVAAEETRFSLCYPIPKTMEGEAQERLARETTALERETDDEVSLRRFPRERTAVLEYRGPAADSPAAYAHLAAWVRQQGLEPAGPPREVYLAEPGTLGKGLMHAEVHQPVA